MCEMGRHHRTRKRRVINFKTSVKFIALIMFSFLPQDGAKMKSSRTCETYVYYYNDMSSGVHDYEYKKYNE